MSKLFQKYQNSSTIQKIATISWVIWVVSILVFVGLVVSLKTIITSNEYATVLAIAGIVVIVLLFTSLMLTAFPQAFKKRKVDK